MENDSRIAAPETSQDRESFVAYTEWLGNIEPLSLEERGELFTMLLQYSKGETVALAASPLVKVTFSFIRQDLDRAYKKRLVQKENGDKGGRPPKSTATATENSHPTITQNNPTITQNNPTITQNNPTEPNHNLNVYVDVDGDVNGYVDGHVKENEKEEKTKVKTLCSPDKPVSDVDISNSSSPLSFSTGTEKAPTTTPEAQPPARPLSIEELVEREYTRMVETGEFKATHDKRAVSTYKACLRRRYQQGESTTGKATDTAEALTEKPPPETETELEERVNREFTELANGTPIAGVASWPRHRINGNDEWTKLYFTTRRKWEYILDADGEKILDCENCATIPDEYCDSGYCAISCSDEAGCLAIKDKLISMGVLQKNDADNPPGLDDECYRILRAKCEIQPSWAERAERKGITTDELWAMEKAQIDDGLFGTTREDIMIRRLSMDYDDMY